MRDSDAALVIVMSAALTGGVKQRREFSSFRKNQRLVRGDHFHYAAKPLLSAKMENIGAVYWKMLDVD